MDKPSKRSIARQVRRLKGKPGWDPANRIVASPEDELERLDQESRTELAYAEDDECAACAEVREGAGDPSALCAEHLGAAMGF